MVFIGFGCITSYFATLKAAQANFPDHRGAAGAAPATKEKKKKLTNRILLI
ncbi:hypothetical protein QCA50_017153 [Cerrena zonata]|uniref:Uncharacterized protein n=1 Tax=Cerrena zonata TaxID=2478898 RepID=A0AAW0FRC7_9APHY